MNRCNMYLDFQEKDILKVLINQLKEDAISLDVKSFHSKKVKNSEQKLNHMTIWYSQNKWIYIDTCLDI
jgi:hypothetical protein